jgi:DNA polymerase elongation subunit (family B)
MENVDVQLGLTNTTWQSAKNDKGNFVGGLSRLIRTGYSRNVLKLDYSSLYPSIQLVHDVFPECDVTGPDERFIILLP